jgi:hypothetical protein
MNRVPRRHGLLGHRLKLKDGTLRSWFGIWRREAAKAARTRARTEKRNATASKRQQEGKAELETKAEPTPVEVQSQ